MEQIQIPSYTTVNKEKLLHSPILQHCVSSVASNSQEAHLAVLEQSRAIIIRHANSTFNKRWHEAEQAIEAGDAQPEAFNAIVKDTDLLDCPLSDLGIKQCEDASAMANSLTNIKTVFISPLRRAMQTAHLLFKDHPNFAQIKFIVHPLLRENMHTVCDIPENFDLVKEEYVQKIPHLDLSEMSTDSLAPWYVHYLQEPVRSKLIQKIEETRGLKTKDVILEEILATYPDRVESALNTHQRCESFKSYVHDYLTALDDTCEGAAGQVAIVGHSMYFSYLTATEWPTQSGSGEFDFTKAPTRFRFLANCEFYPFDSHMNLYQQSMSGSSNCSPMSGGGAEATQSSTSSSNSD